MCVPPIQIPFSFARENVEEKFAGFSNALNGQERK